MRDYAKISSRFWTGKSGRALRGDKDAQLVALYLMSSPHSTMIGVYHCPLVYIAHETGLGLEGASKGLQRLVEGDFCTYDEDTETVWVHEMAKWQIGETLKPHDKQAIGVKKQFAALPESLIKQGFHTKYMQAYGLPPRETPPPPHADQKTGAARQQGSQGASKHLRSQEQEQEQEQDKEQEQKQDQAQELVSRPAAPNAPGKKGGADPEVVTAFQQACRATWTAYAEAYQQRYGTPPVRNAKVNRQVQEIVKRLGAEDAPRVAEWYLRHPAAYYVGRCHDIAAMVPDLEKLRTEWATGRVVTAGKARQADRTGTNQSALQEALAMIKGEATA